MTTERQALVEIVAILNSLLETGVGDSVAISTVTEGSVQEGVSSYRAGELEPLSLSPQGRLRVQMNEPMPPRLLAGPWGAGAPFSGSPWGG